MADKQSETPAASADTGSVSPPVPIPAHVVSSIAAHAAQAVPGVATLRGSPLDLVGGFLTRKVEEQGARVDMSGGTAVIEIHLEMHFGQSLAGVAERVTDAVRRAVETSAGVRVSAVHVIVESLRLGRSGVAA